MQYHGVIRTVYSKYGLADFDLEGRTQTARFSNLNTHINGIAVPTSRNLKRMMRYGTEVTLYNLTLSPEAHFEAHVNIIDENELSNPSVHTKEDLDGREFLGLVISVKLLSGVAKFHIDGNEERAYFWREDTSIDGDLVRQDVKLSSTVTVGAEVLLSGVRPCATVIDQMVCFKATANVLGFTQIYAQHNFTRAHLKKLTFNGVVTSVSDRSGLVSFHLNGEEVQALFARIGSRVNGIALPGTTPLTEYLKVGLEADVTNVRETHGQLYTTQYLADVNIHDIADELQSSETFDTTEEADDEESEEDSKEDTRRALAVNRSPGRDNKRCAIPRTNKVAKRKRSGNLIPKVEV